MRKFENFGCFSVYWLRGIIGNVESIKAQKTGQPLSYAIEHDVPIDNFGSFKNDISNFSKRRKAKTKPATPFDINKLRFDDFHIDFDWVLFVAVFNVT